MTNQIEIQRSPYIGHNVKKKLKHQSSIAKNLIQRFLFKICIDFLKLKILKKKKNPPKHFFNAESNV